MITGETGTGKELVGRAVHNQSPRSEGRFVTVSCATIPESQISKVLFGTESEAGKLEEANGGSLFLDSITDLPATQQMLLLRFMQSGQLEDHRGGQRNVDVRIITSCHNNIDDAVKNGTFREDLYYRLNILHIEIPPLRDRIGDVDSLAQFFFSKFSSESPGRIKGFSHLGLVLRAQRMVTVIHRLISMRLEPRRKVNLFVRRWSVTITTLLRLLVSLGFLELRCIG